MAQRKIGTIVDDALKECRPLFKVVFLFSMAINFLMIALPIYSMQVLDRVISSGSYETLTLLTLLAILLFATSSLFHIFRSSAMNSMGIWLDKKLSPRLLALSISYAATRATASGSQNLRDLSVFKNFITGPNMAALLDAPWALVYLLVIFIINPILGLVTALGGILLFVLALFNEYAMRAPLDEANETAIRSLSHAEISTRNSEVVEAMGMADAVINQWKQINNKVQELQTIAAERSGIIYGISKFARLAIQIIILAIGTSLAIVHTVTPGAIIACSILASRALAPFEAAISLWKSAIDARKSYDRMKRTLTGLPPREKSISLPRPKGELTLERVVYAPPIIGARAIIKGISFTVKPGDILGMIGPSASGKSTLAKLITGVWQPSNGTVRLDSADVYNWDRAQFGEYVGYLPQDVELFKGTVKENIARMKEEASDEDIIEAAQTAGAHELILHLPKGYETDIGIGGTLLSAGQRQRIGLARAFFGNPQMLILDEPNSNLDEAGEAALVQAVSNAKVRGMTVIIISHRQNILSVVDKIMVMRDGLLEAYGPAQEIIARYRAAAAGASAQPQPQQAASPQPALAKG